MAIKLVPAQPAMDESDARIERLTALAVKVFGNRDRAMRWLHRPRREFGGVSPLEMMETEAAAAQVEAILTDLDREETR